MRSIYRTLNDCEMRHNAEVGRFTKPSILIGIIIAVLSIELMGKLTLMAYN
jgi:hypothetical protein